MIKQDKRVAIVTGGSQGIGRAIALDYANEGIIVVIVNRRNKDNADKVVKEIESANGEAYSKLCDLSNVEQGRALIKEVHEQFGRIDILVNNAGVFIDCAIDETTPEDWDITINTNLKGVYFLTQAVIPIMKQQGGGKVVCISSVADTCTFPGASMYCISKAGLSMLVKAFAKEYAQYNININGVAPGNTETPINQHIRDNPEMVGWIKERTPTGRAYLKPNEVSKAVVFLSSENASAIHGVIIAVDDGWLIG